MNNNVATTSIRLPRTIGDTMEFDELEELSSISRVSGELSVGMLLFDIDGTMAACTAITTVDEDRVYTFKTLTLNTEIDIQDILAQGY